MFPRIRCGCVSLIFLLAARPALAVVPTPESHFGHKIGADRDGARLGEGGGLLPAAQPAFFQYDVTRDASRFLVNSLRPEAPLTLVSGWPAALRR